MLVLVATSFTRFPYSKILLKFHALNLWDDALGMQLFVLIISLYLGALRDEVKGEDGVVIVLFFFKRKVK